MKQRDLSLMISQCLVDGVWVGERVDPVHHLATGALIARVPRFGAISTELAPFGGVRESGVGREGSRHGVEEFVEIKYLMMSGLDQ